MSTLEEIVSNDSPALSHKVQTDRSLYSRFLKLLCSVRLGVTLLILLGLACLTGMLVMQQTVDGFDRYFADLSSIRREIYSTLGLFDIYHSWYFNALLALLSLNIILASVDRFPKSWIYVSKPAVSVPIRWLRDQVQTAEVELDSTGVDITAHVSQAINSGWGKPVITEKNGVTYVFGQRGAWNRLTAYLVHIGLLTIFTGGILTAQLSSGGQLPLRPGTVTNLIKENMVDRDQTRVISKQLPFEIRCVDIQQRLIKREGALSPQNTIDWVTKFTIRDETGMHEALVQMNQPYDHRGYRFFQSSSTQVGKARTITLKATPVDGGESQSFTIPRNGQAELTDGTKIAFTEFHGDLRMAEDEGENTSDYKNPGAIVEVNRPGGEPGTAYAVGPQLGKSPFANRSAAGYTFELTDFERVADQHILSVRRDPGAGVVYAGFVMLFLALSGVFLFSHQRLWAAIEGNKVVLGGHTNRNVNAFDAKFQRFVHDLQAVKE